MLLFINSSTTGKGNVIISITQGKKRLFLCFFFFKSPYFINKFERRWEETNISVPGISCEMSFSLHRCERID